MINKKNTLRLILGFYLVLISLNFISGATYSDTTSTKFDININELICSDDGTYFTDYRTDPSTTIPTIGTALNANCYDFLSETSCCPIGSNCNLKGTGPNGAVYGCFASEINYCRDYTNENDCENYTKWVAEKSVEGLKDNDKFCNNYLLGSEYKKNGKSCWDFVAGCQCYWNSVNNSCQPKFSNVTQCEDDDEPSAPSYCEYTITDWVDNCATTGFIDAVWDTNLNSGECIDGNRQIPCEEVTQLGFFNWINFVLTISVIFIIYSFYLIRKK